MVPNEVGVAAEPPPDAAVVCLDPSENVIPLFAPVTNTFPTYTLPVIPAPPVTIRVPVVFELDAIPPDTVRKVSIAVFP
jgi:hypothetical protein